MPGITSSSNWYCQLQQRTRLTENTFLGPDQNYSFLMRHFLQDNRSPRNESSIDRESESNPHFYSLQLAFVFRARSSAVALQDCEFGRNLVTYLRMFEPVMAGVPCG
jgi:hypothetical protein